jgi:hypothetical protein
MESDELSEREKAAVLWAEHVTKNTARDHDDIYLKCREQFSEEEMVELTLMSGMFNMFNRLMDSLKIPLEIQDEVDLIKRSVDLDPDKVKTYFSNVTENWPSEFPKPNPD